MKSYDPAGEQGSLDFEAAQERRELGMQRAEDSAQRADPGWPDRAVEQVRKYAESHGEFLAEDVRHHAEDNGFPKPPEPRAWGPVMSKAVKAGICEFAGYQRAKDSNLSPKVLWRSLVISQRSSACA